MEHGLEADIDRLSREFCHDVATGQDDVTENAKRLRRLIVLVMQQEIAERMKLVMRGGS